MLATQITIGNPMPMGPPIVDVGDPKSMSRPTGQSTPRLTLDRAHKRRPLQTQPLDHRLDLNQVSSRILHIARRSPKLR